MSGLVRGTATLAALLVLSAAALADPPASPTKPDSAPTEAAKTGTAENAAAKPDVATLLFGTPQWDKAPAGSKLRYSFEKTTADPAFGAGFKDEVVETLGAGDNPRSRTTEMQLFSGANRRPAGPFRSDEQNPVMLVVLENNVQEMSKLFQANPRYLKNAIRKAWRDSPKIETATDTVEGKPVTVTRVVVSPFVGDLEADRMKGLSSLTYTVDVSNEVPGSIVAIDIHAADDGKTRFAETLHYLSKVGP